jgi:hypothetical protein
MNRKAATEKPKRDLSGVPGELVKIEGLDLEWRSKFIRKSPYDAKLDELAAAPPGTALRFGDPRALVALRRRARKKGLNIAFAEKDGVLFVRILARANGSSPVQEIPPLGATRRARILQTLRVGPAKTGDILRALRGQGDTTVNLPMVEIIVSQMVGAGQLIHKGSAYALSANWAAGRRA